jgi:hypothetical protein
MRAAARKLSDDHAGVRDAPEVSAYARQRRSRLFIVRQLEAVRALTPDGRLLFGARCARLFAYGFLSVALVLYLSAVGLSDRQIGLLLTMTLLGDTVISLGISTAADRTGRRAMLIVGALLMTLPADCLR